MGYEPRATSREPRAKLRLGPASSSCPPARLSVCQPAQLPICPTARVPRLLITGGTGTFGGTIARQLAESGVTGKALVRGPDRAESLSDLGFEIVAGDLTEPESLPAAIDGVDRILLWSGNDPHQVAAQRTLIDAAVAAGVRHVVMVSAHSAGLTPPVSFGVAHHAIEEQVQRSGLSWTIVRPYLFMQNFVRFALKIVSRGKVIAPVNDAGVAMVDMHDVAAVAVRALTEDHHVDKTYEVSGPEALSFARATHIISHVTGKQVTHINPPRILTGLLLKTMTDLSSREIPLVLQLFDSIRAGDQDRVTDVFAQVVGQIPRTFDDYVREHVEVFGG